MKTIILCGGAGTRLWPISRKKNPKQFSPIFDNESLFQKTINRNSHLSNSLIVVVNEVQLPICKKQVSVDLVNNTHFLIEPIGRNTAPAIALAAMQCEPEEILLVLPSDHLIKDQSEYEKCIKQAVTLAQDNKLVTFGIKAEYPETGFGYIEADGVNVKSFKEKPDLETAMQYIEAGNYFWNSGMFCFKAETFLDELKMHSPEIYQQTKITFENANRTKQIINFNLTDMQLIPSLSIDYAVMEKSSNVCVIASSFHWSDVGSFDSLYEELPKDANGNTLCPSLESINSNNNLFIGNKRVIATFDINDLIIVDTEDALLIGKRGDSQKVKDLVNKIKLNNPALLD